MNWKKWNKNTWVNMNSPSAIHIVADDGRFYVCYPKAAIDVKYFDTHAEAVAFIEELISRRYQMDEKGNISPIEVIIK